MDAKNAWGVKPACDAIMTHDVTNGPYYFGHIDNKIWCVSECYMKKTMSTIKVEEKVVEDTTKVNIKGIDKVKLLKELWLASAPAKFFSFRGMETPPFDEKLAMKAVLKYIDYFQGRAIKTDLTEDVVDVWLYDRDAGKGMFSKCVNKCK